MKHTTRHLRLAPALSLFATLLLLQSQPARAQEVVIDVPLGGVAHEMVFDAARQRFYITVPENNEVVIVSTAPFAIDGAIPFGSPPRGIDLSHDGRRLFVALNGAGAVGVVDLATNNVTSIPIGSELGDARTWDVLEAQPDRLFVTSNPGSNGFAWVVQVLLDQGNAASRVASNNIIRASPVLEVSPDENFLYVGSGFSPNSLYKLDLGQPTAPIVLEDDHGSVSGTSQLKASPDGTRIHLGSGQVLGVDDFEQEVDLPSGIARYGVAPGIFYLALFPSSSGNTVTVNTYDDTTYIQANSFTVPCPVQRFGSFRDFFIVEGDAGFLFLNDDRLCGSVNPAGLPDTDEDGIADAFDNCPFHFNPNQEDRDNDGFGDPCDPFPDEMDHLIACFNALAASEDRVLQLEGEVAALTTQVQQLMNENGALRTENTALESQKTALLAQLQQCETERSALQGENAALQGENAVLQGENATLQSANAALTEEVGTLNEQIAALVTEIARLEGLVDTDCDGVPDFRDLCPGSRPKGHTDENGCQPWQLNGKGKDKEKEPKEPKEPKKDKEKED